MVKVYSKDSCVQCTATYRKMDAVGVEYKVINVEKDPEALEFIKELGYLRAPVVVVDDVNHWGGFDPDRIDTLMK